MSTLLPLLANTRDISNQLKAPSLLIIDLSSQEHYLQGHIPGAIHVDSSRLILGEKPAPGQLPSEQQLSALFNEIGLTEDAHVLVYDDQDGAWAGRFIWTLDIIKHPHYSALDGGRAAWIADGGALETTANSSTGTTSREFTFDYAVVAKLDEIREALGSDEQAIWDARSPEEYQGIKVLAARGGHIPGAKNYDWQRLMDKQQQNRLRPLNEIQNELKALGLSQDKHIITHCQTHRRSGLTYLVAKALGYPNIKAYPGSWSEWGNHEDTPIEAGQA
jgi:thiosulfate/3-mercaptopyruvate sulfurtransferase